MPKGPRGETRPADVIGCAVSVAQISVGEVEDDRYRSPGRVRSGLSGAKARMVSLGSEKRTEIAKKAATARWG